MSNGKVVQVIGAVVDVEFPRGEIPKIYDALLLDEFDLTLEVQQQLGDGVVRTICVVGGFWQHRQRLAGTVRRGEICDQPAD